MKLSIRSKFTIAISLLILVIFSIVSALFITEKKREIADDIYVNALAFSKLTASSVVYDYDTFLAQNSFVYFNREIKKIFEQNDDIFAMKVISYAGETLYDSSTDTEKRYEGPVRMVVDEALVKQVKSRNVSVNIGGVLYFVKANLNGGIYYVDAEDKRIGAPASGSLVETIVVPANDKYSVVYYVDYANLDLRVMQMIERIIYLAVFGILLGVFIAFIMSGQVVRPISALVDGARRIAKGDFKTQVEVKTNDEMQFLGEAFNTMAGELAASMEAKIYEQRVKRELELAAQIQDQIVPDQKDIPQPKGLEIAAGLNPATEIGGDIYDFLPLDDGKKLLMYLGDVTGHGVPAGIVSSIASALFYGYGTTGDLALILIEVNRVMKAKTMPNMFITLCLMLWDSVAGRFTYANAGHEQVLHYSATSKRAAYLPSGGIALGMIKDISAHVKVEEAVLEIGDVVVIYSDGIPEAWKNDKELFGLERLKQAVERIVPQGGSCEQIRDAILQEVYDFENGHQQMDDITILVIRRV